MPANKNDSPEPEGSPRSRFGRFFSRKEKKKENDPCADKTKSYENEASQTVNEDDEKSTKNVEEESKNKNTKNTLQDDKPDNLIDEFPAKDARKLIETELGSNKLTTLINNSIKEAVRSIVKDGVCDFVDSQENPPSSTPKKSKDKELKKAPNLNQDLTPAKDSNKEKSVLNSEEKKTFDSHSQDPARRSPRSPQTPTTPRTPRTPCASSPHKCPERATVSQCDRSICPAYTSLDVERLKRSKHKKSKKKQNVSTDNRRMTGNVNIYICSEANENVKRKCPEKDKCSEDSGSETETKSSTSASSVSTTKLVDALKKKRRKKTEVPELECLCEAPEDDMQEMENSTKKISDVPDEMSSFSRLNYTNDNVSSTDYLDGCSLQNCPALSTNDFDYQYASYDNNNSWDAPRNSNKNYSFLPAERDVPVQDTFRESVCSSCKLPKSPRAPCVCESHQKLNSVATNYPENNELVSYNEPVEKVEEETQCCGATNESAEFTLCTNQPIDELLLPVAGAVTTAEGLSNESMKNEDITLEKEDSTKKDDSDTAQPGNTKRESFLQRSWKRAISIVKRPRTSVPEANASDQRKISQEPQKSKSSELKINGSITSQPKNSSSSSLNGSQTSRKRQGKPKILAKISSKQKQRESTQSDSKIPPISNIPKPGIVSSPQDLKKPQEEDQIKLDSEYGKPKEEPKIIPCTFLASEEPQPKEFCASCNKKKINCECCQKCSRPQESGKCRCPEPPREPKCCTCKRETSGCTCRPAIKNLKSYKSRAPVRKCSYCGMASDICNCQEPPCPKGRAMMPDKNSGMRGNWKSRPGVPSHFPRERVNRENPDNCHCDQSKPYGSEELPYQKLNVFSNVMTELQQKISDSVHCNKCNNTLCSCPKPPKCLSTIAERPSSPHHNDSPIDCKCPRAKRKTTTFAVCDNCQTSPCRCRRDKRPQAKCFYCKTMPCRCNWKYKKPRQQFDADDCDKRNTRSCRCPSPNRLMNNGKDSHPTPRHRPHKSWID